MGHDRLHLPLTEELPKLRLILEELAHGVVFAALTHRVPDGLSLARGANFDD